MKNLAKGKQIFLYVAPFPALAFFKIWSAPARTPEGMLAVSLLMLLYSALVIFIAFRWDHPTYFDWVIGGYFVVLAFALLIWPLLTSPLITRYGVTGVYSCLFAAAFFPLLLRMDPFTYHYAKKWTPEFLWGNPIFIRINRIMTLVWSGLFALAIILSIYPSVVTRALIPIGLIVGFGLPFNLRFPDYYLRRLGLPRLKEQRRMARGDVPARMGATVKAKDDTEEAAPVAARSNTIRPVGKEVSMKVLALNSSPRGEGQSKTELLLNSLIEGMQERGALVEVVHLRKKTIKNCVGCFSCWTTTPGRCVHRDDMTEELFPKWIDADLVVYATPLYHFTVNATMKAFIERTLPALHPFFEAQGGRTRHPWRHEPPKAVMLSVAGFPEKGVFNQLSSWAQFIFGNNLVAEIYRPSAELLQVPFFAGKAKAVLDAVREAGRELAESGKISEGTMAGIGEPLAEDRETADVLTNLMWKTCIAEAMTPKEFQAAGLIPRADSIASFMVIMPMGFNALKAGDVKATLQFVFSGSVEGECHFLIEKGTIKAGPGVADKPDLTIETPFDVWMDIMTGKADGQHMFMTQQYTAKGDFSLLLRMRDFFGR